MIKIFISILAFQSILNHSANEFCTLHFIFNNESVNNGFVHLLSNDKFINDISVNGLDMIERESKSCKIDNKGYYRIRKKEISRLYNNIGLDSINGIVRCDNGFGFFFTFKLSRDTINIYLTDTTKNSCFRKRGRK